MVSPGAPRPRRPALNPYDLSTWRRDREAEDAVPTPSHDPTTVAEEGAGPDPRVDPPREEEDDEAAWDPAELPRDLVDPFELARRTVNQSRAAARDRGLFPISAKTQARDVRDRSASAPGYSGARPDPRDPQGIEAVLRRVLGSLGWSEGMSSGRVLEEWDEIVGEQIAAHCRPVTLDAGILVVSASSSAWATQLRMLSPQLITRIHEHVGASVISELKVTGPAAQSWKKGRRTVTWRGPRDTYG
ncbi:DciA family protein [Brachybacterium huguangmaarense]|uniref:DciA family protein n=1 Tax=Brachybacterium huguangmaarense TaxID=1652028 RepID=A0ABY6G3D4_9MICO|nr:DciA family protein [Brachybacterium huguangmaarense]UYG17627.1 DciA family protein [Brachybacterium huguangmaarense]